MTHQDLFNATDSVAIINNSISVNGNYKIGVARFAGCCYGC